MSQSDQSETSKFAYTPLEVPRDGDGKLSFEGEKLGTGMTSVPALDRVKDCLVTRGHECEIYVTRSEKYVIAFRAWSNVSGEVNKRKASICANAQEVLDFLRNLTPEGMPEAAREALDNAALRDPRLKR